MYPVSFHTPSKCSIRIGLDLSNQCVVTLFERKKNQLVPAGNLWNQATTNTDRSGLEISKKVLKIKDGKTPKRVLWLAGTGA